MAIVEADIEFRLSGGATNTDPTKALGGAMSTDPGGVIVSGDVHNLFDAVTGDQAAAGHTDYRCFYVKNDHGSLTWIAPKLWELVETTSADTTYQFALAGEGVDGTAETIANETAAPSGESFTAPTSKGAGLSIADVPPGKAFAVWIKRIVDAGADPANDSGTLRVEGDSNP